MDALTLTVVCHEGTAARSCRLPHGIGAVPGQVATAAKPGEVLAVRDLLKALTDLAGAVITVGALHTQGDTAQAVTGRHAGDVMTVKPSMPALYEQLEKLPWTAIPATSAVRTGHGRRAHRTIRAVLVPARTGFAGAARVAQVRRAVTGEGKKTAGVVYLMTSGRDAGPATVAAWVRGHREIETGFPAPSRPRPAADAKAAPDCVSGFAVSRAAGLPL